ncbi:hypothetical protein [Pontibacter anaerobius]|uniref:Uncharacterized protein n=1 Tax=Pontibacter anaerobius TaxID=2993940 RepID=A0ABT3RBY2_9BACT|nr:hypothetical protein [Pontibacter anaerobius]MCX2738913.1 hypothetical protein [Pontibacter anaerobius]
MKKAVLAIVAILIILVVRLWFGIYLHDEFGETHLFLKHRPTWKWEFYSPLGMSDLRIEDLPKEKRNEQLLFEEFVSSRGMSR